jgi:hypothetical protein
VNDCVLSDDAVLWRVHLHHLEFHLSHTASYCEQVTLSDWAVRLAEVRSKVDIEERAGKTLDGIGDGEDGDAFGLSQRNG